MRICIVGCGAVGSLFAANLANLDDVEVWAYDLDKAHVDAINKNGLQLVGAGEVSGARGRRAIASELPPCDFGIVATKAMHTEAAIAATAHAFAGVRSRRCRTASATRRRSPRTSSRVIRGTTFPAGKILAPGVVQWDVKGDTTLGPFEPKPARGGRDRAAGGRLHACRHADACRRRCAARAVAQGDLQRRDQPDRRAHGSDARARLRGSGAARARLGARRRGQGGRGGAGDRPRRRSRGADRPRGQAGGRVRAQGEHAPGRRGSPAARKWTT